MWCYPSRPHILQEPRNRRKTRSVEGKNRVKAANREKHHGSGKGSHCKVKGHGHWNHLCGEKAFANQNGAMSCSGHWLTILSSWCFLFLSNHGVHHFTARSLRPANAMFRFWRLFAAFKIDYAGCELWNRRRFWPKLLLAQFRHSLRAGEQIREGVECNPGRRRL